MLNSDAQEDLFSLRGKVAMVTGVLGGEMARALARSGAAVALLGRREQKSRSLAREIEREGAEALALPADVLDRIGLQQARVAVVGRWGRVDILVNAAGGNVPEATLGPAGFFELPEDALRRVVDLNLLGTVLPCQVFGSATVGDGKEPEGCIVNVTSMAADQRGRILGRQGRRRELHALARRRARTHPRAEPQGQRNSTWLLPGGAEPRDAPRRRREPLPSLAASAIPVTCRARSSTSAVPPRISSTAS